MATLPDAWHYTYWVSDGTGQLVSEYCEWVRWKVSSATSISVWHYVHLSAQIRPRDTPASCLDVKQATNKQTYNPSLHIFLDGPLPRLNMPFWHRSGDLLLGWKHPVCFWPPLSCFTDHSLSQVKVFPLLLLLLQNEAATFTLVSHLTLG